MLAAMHVNIILTQERHAEASQPFHGTESEVRLPVVKTTKKRLHI